VRSARQIRGRKNTPKRTRSFLLPKRRNVALIAEGKSKAEERQPGRTKKEVGLGGDIEKRDEKEPKSRPLSRRSFSERKR